MAYRAAGDGKAPSGAASGTSPLERAMRRLAEEHDAAILRATGTDDGLDDLVAWTGAHTTVEE